jgi:hypothetical protein
MQLQMNGALLSSARLMSPKEVRAATADNLSLSGPLDGWYLCGDASESMVDTLRQGGGRVGIRLTGGVGEAGGHYAFITQQVGHEQHRFVLPLYDRDAAEYLLALRHEPIQLMLGRAGEEAAVICRDRLSWSLVAPLVALCQTAPPKGPLHALCEWREVVQAACEVDSVPLVQGDVVERVCVSAIVPSLETLYSGGTGRMAAGGRA